MERWRYICPNKLVAAAKDTKDASSVVAPGVGATLRVLVVEDHWANRRLLEAMLIKQGHIMEVGVNLLAPIRRARIRREILLCAWIYERHACALGICSLLSCSILVHIAMQEHCVKCVTEGLT